MLDTLALVEPRISVQKKQQGNKTTNYPQIESRKILELKIEMSLNVTSAKWLGKASTNQIDLW